MENQLLLEQGCRIARYEGMKAERKMIRELTDLAIENRDREGFEFLKERHNNLVSEIKIIEKDIERDMAIIDKMLQRKIKEKIENISHDDILEILANL